MRKFFFLENEIDFLCHDRTYFVRIYSIRFSFGSCSVVLKCIKFDKVVLDQNKKNYFSFYKSNFEFKSLNSFPLRWSNYTVL